MERNESFVTANLNDVAIRLAWAQVEIFADDIERVQVLAAGDENSVRDLRIEIKEDALVVEQPQYGLSLNIMDSHWMQVCVRVPRTWERKLHVSTISGLLNARGLNGSRIVLDTVSGDVRATKLTAKELSLKTVTGELRADTLNADSVSIRTVSGAVGLDDVAMRTCRGTTVSGDVRMKLRTAFETVEVRSVSGDVTLLTGENRVNASLRSVSGRVATDGVELTEERNVPSVRVTAVSADLRLICAKA